MTRGLRVQDGAAGSAGAGGTEAAVALLARVALAALDRASLRAWVLKHCSSDESTRSSTTGTFSPMTSEISETTRNLARSSIRFSRKDKLLDLARWLKLLSTSTTS